MQRYIYKNIHYNWSIEEKIPPHLVMLKYTMTVTEGMELHIAIQNEHINVYLLP